MKIAIVGAGGIGGYLAVKLIVAGAEVALVARGSHRAAIAQRGLRLVEPDGEVTVKPPVLTDDLGEIGLQDLVIVAVKAHQLSGAITQLHPALGPETRVLPFQNGVDAPDLLARSFGRDRALIGVARIFANITAPGVITRYGVPRRFSIGALDGSQSSVGDILACFRAAGIEAPDLDDIRTDLWTKFILFNATSSITAGTRCRFGVLRDLPEVVDLARTIMKETHAVGVASGVPLPETLIEECLRLFLEELPSDGRTSTAHDLEDGRALEIDYVSGAVARRGRELGVDVTASETVYALLRPWRDGR